MVKYKEFEKLLKKQLFSYGLSKTEFNDFMDELSCDFSIKGDNIMNCIYCHLRDWNVSKSDAKSFCDDLADKLLFVNKVSKIHSSKNKIVKSHRGIKKNPVNHTFQIDEEPMTKQDFAYIKDFLKHLRCKRGEFMVVELKNSHLFKNINFVQTCRCKDGSYRIEAGIEENGENMLYRLDKVNLKIAINEFKAVCVDLQRPEYLEWDDVTDDVIVRPQKSARAIEGSIDLDDDTTITFHAENN